MKSQELFPAPSLLQPIVAAASALLVAWKDFRAGGDIKDKQAFYLAWELLEGLMNPERLQVDDANLVPGSSIGWPAPCKVVVGLREISETVLSIGKKCGWPIGDRDDPTELPPFDPLSIQSHVLTFGSVFSRPLRLDRLGDADMTPLRHGKRRVERAVAWAKKNVPQFWLPKSPVSANISVKFFGRRPTASVEKLAHAIAGRGKRSMAAVAREICGDKAASTLTQVRRLKRKNRIRFVNS